jgi:hypothetical protein
LEVSLCPWVAGLECSENHSRTSSNYTPHSSWKIIVEVEGLQYYFNPERGQEAEGDERNIDYRRTGLSVIRTQKPTTLAE